jgi:hypothetical protein
VSGGAVVATARVLLGVDDSTLSSSLHAAKATTASAVGSMRHELTTLEEASIKVKLAQQSYNAAVAKFGPEARQAQAALVRLSGAQRAQTSELQRSSGELGKHRRQLSGFSSDLNNAHKTGERTFRGMVAGTNAFKGLGRQVAFASTAFLGGAGFIAVLKSSVSGASDLHEQLTKSDVVFRRSSRSVEEWSRKSATALLMTRAEAMKYVTTFGNMLVPMGFARERAARMSQTMVKLAADMASFNNADPSETLAALQSGLAGQVRPLRQFGVFLDQNRIKAVALATGIVKADVSTRSISEAQKGYAISQAKLDDVRKHFGKNSTQLAAAELNLARASDRVAKATAGHVPALTAAQKAAAVYKIILKDTADAQGDVERTSGGFANQTRILKAQIGNLQEELGGALLPSILHVTKAVTHWLGQTKNQERLHRDLNKAVKIGVTVVTEIAKAIKTGWTIFQTAAGWIGGAKRAVEALLLAMAVNKMRSIASSIVTTLITNGIALVGPAAEGEAIAYGTSMSAMGLATKGLGLAIKTTLISTGIGAIAVAAGIAAVLVIQHWGTIKHWIVEFGQWIKAHVKLLLAVPVIGTFLFMAVEVIKHWNSIKKVVAALATFFGTVFVHPIRAIKQLFSDLWSILEGGAIRAVLKIIEPFSHLPFGMGKWAQKMKDKLHGALEQMKADAAAAGTTIGTNVGANAQSALQPYLDSMATSIGALSVGGGAVPGSTAKIAGSGIAPRNYAHRVLGETSGLATLQGEVNSLGGAANPAINFTGHAGGPTGDKPNGASYHYSGEALDITGAEGTLQKIWDYLVARRDNFAELFWKSQAFYWGVPGNEVAGHYDHIHVAFTGSEAEAKKIIGQKTKAAQTTPKNDGNNTNTNNTNTNTGGGGGGLHVEHHSHKKKGKHAKIPLVPYALQIALDEADIKGSAKEQLAALKAIEHYLVEKIRHTKDIAQKVKLLNALKTVTAREDKLAGGGSGAIPHPVELEQKRRVAQAKGDFVKVLELDKQIIAWLQKRIHNARNAKQALKLHNQLVREQAQLTIDGAKAQKQLATAREKERNEKNKADVAAINATSDDAQRVIDRATGGSGRGWHTEDVLSGPDADKIKNAEEDARIKKAKLAAAKAKFDPNSTQVAEAQLAYEKAQQAVAAAKSDKGHVVGKKVVGDPRVSFDPKTGKYVVTTVGPDVAALKKELEYLISTVLPKLDKEIRNVGAAIKRLSKHPKANRGNIKRLKAKLQALKHERAQILNLASSLSQSIKEINDAIAAEPNPEPTDDGPNVDPGSGSDPTVDTPDAADSLHDPHGGADASTGLTNLELREKLGGSFDTDAGRKSRADYITQKVVPGLQSDLSDLESQRQSAILKGNEVLAGLIAEAIAQKQNDILQAQLDAQDLIAQNTGDTAAAANATDTNIAAYLGALAGIRSYGSNVFNNSLFGASPDLTSGAGAGGATINVTANFPVAPADPHLFSQSIAFEIKSIFA